MATKFATPAAEAAHKKDLAARRAARSAAIKAETPVQKALRLAKRRRRNLHKAFAQLGNVGRYSLPIKAREQLVREIVDWADEACKAIMRQSGGKDGLPELASE